MINPNSDQNTSNSFTIIEIENPVWPEVFLVISVRSESVFKARIRNTLEKENRDWLTNEIINSTISHNDQGLPVFPSYCVGSLSHSGGHVALVTGPGTMFKSIGVDLEIAEPDPDHVWPLKSQDAILHSVKEAAFKCVASCGGNIESLDDLVILGMDYDKRRGKVAFFQCKQLNSSVFPNLNVWYKEVSLSSHQFVVSVCVYEG